MAKGGISTKVRLLLVVEVSAGEWGDECSVEQVRKQTKDAAEGAARRLKAILDKQIVEQRVEHVSKVLEVRIDGTYDVQLREPT